MTLWGVRFSRAAPFVKRGEFHVQPASHSRSPFTAQSSHSENRPLSALIAISSPRFPDPTFPRLSLGDTQGSKNLGQADNMPVSKKQARKHGRTRRGSGKQIRITFAEASSGRVAYPPADVGATGSRPSLSSYVNMTNAVAEGGLVYPCFSSAFKAMSCLCSICFCLISSYKLHQSRPETTSW